MDRPGSTTDSSTGMSPYDSPFESSRFIFPNDNSQRQSPLQLSLTCTTQMKSPDSYFRSHSCTGISPCYSPISSPNTSRTESPIHSSVVSPNSTPILQLKRADSYKHTQRKQENESSNRKKVILRLRSKSTPDISMKCVVFGPVEERHNSTTSEDTTAGKVSPEKTNTETVKSPGVRRKKSLAVLLGLTSIELPDFRKLKRSNSQRLHRARRRKSSSHVTKSNSLYLNDDSSDDYDGPLFQATTLFVPGYDFKTKQSTPLLGRKYSTPFFSRKGSSTNMHQQEKEKRNSTPNLFRRGSMEGGKKSTNKTKHTNKTMERSMSSPPGIDFQSSSDEESYPFTENVLTIPQRKVQIEDKIKKFEDHKKYPASRCDVSEVFTQGKVKRISMSFENGTAYYNIRGRIEGLQTYGSQHFEHEFIYRERIKSFENNNITKIRSISNIDTTSLFPNGDESGYESPVDNNYREVTQENGRKEHEITDLNSNIRFENDYTSELRFTRKTENSVEPQTNCSTDHKLLSPKNNASFNVIQSEETDRLSDSWSQGQWKNTGRSSKTFYNVLTPDIARVISTDFCVTEL